jgi:hypothetical protein
MKKLMSVEVKGQDHSWSFMFYGNPAHLKDWREDQLEVNEIINIIPEWVVDLGLTKVWCFFQDLFNFKR